MCYCIELCCVTKFSLFIHHFQSPSYPFYSLRFNMHSLARTYIPLQCILFINRSRQVQIIAAHSFTWKSILSLYLFKLFNHIIFSIILSHSAQLVIFNTLINVIWYVWFVEGLLVSGKSILSYIFAFSSSPHYSWILALVPRPIFHAISGLEITAIIPYASS